MAKSKNTHQRSIWDAQIARRALIDSLPKLNPLNMMKNPVMFVVEIGSVITTVLLLKNLRVPGGSVVFDLQITLWLWFTVLFANFAEAMAEGRGKAQADALRRAKSETMANRLTEKGVIEQVPSSKLCSGNIVIVSRGRNDSRRRRYHRRRRVGRRVRYHRRISPGHSRVRRRSLGGYRRDAGIVRSDQNSHHLQRRRNLHR